MLLLPGLLCDESLWDLVVPSVRSVASPLAIDLTKSANIQAMAADALKIAPDTFVLAGFSMGGQVALEICRMAPERVQGLCLMSTNAHGLTPAVHDALSAAKGRILRDGIDAYLAGACEAYFAHMTDPSPAIRDRFLRMGRRLGADVALRQIDALLDYRGFEPPLSSLRMPTMLICGERDARTPVGLHRQMSTDMGNAPVHVVPGSGHFTMLEAPDVVASLLSRWCSRVLD